MPEDKENAALMLGEVIRLTSAAALQPSVVHITGPLIRILGDRFNSSVKAAVLETLALLLSKVRVSSPPASPSNIRILRHRQLFVARRRHQTFWKKQRTNAEVRRWA